MSYPNANDPAALHAPPPAFEYVRMYSYVFDNPNWLMNLVWGALCIISQFLIPIVGPLLLLGYQFEIIDALLASRGQRYPDFDLNRFGDYLGRSLWPFLVKLVAGLVLGFALLMVIAIPVVAIIAIASSAGEDAAAPFLAIGIPLLVLVLVPLAFLTTMPLVPMAFRAGMTGSFGEGFNFDWVKDYLRRVWFELLLAMLFLAFSGFALTVCGLLACVLPVLLVQPLVLFAEAHLMYQLYLLYLSRGGQPIPARVVTPPVPLPQAMMPQHPPTF
jgi:hypothetical protein